MHTPNPSRQKKNHQKALSRKGKSEPRKGGRSNKRYGGATVGQLKSRFFAGGPGYGAMCIPQETNHHRDNKKSNGKRNSIKAKLKRRREAHN